MTINLTKIMRKTNSNTSLIITFSLSLVVSITASFVSSDAMAGSRSCKSYSDNTTICINEKGYKLYCRTERGDGYDGKKDICVGKGNYRKECIGLSRWASTCIDSKGIKTKCESYGSSGVSYCERNDGTRSRCVSYSAQDYSTCNDIDKKGNPI
jgi:hypothetical protein